MKTVSVLMNSPYLGGAERSILQQASMIKSDYKVKIYIPFFDSIDEAELLVAQAKKLGHSTFHFMKYPETLFKASRTQSSIKFLEPVLFLLGFIFQLRNNPLFHSEIIWANGNKIAFVTFLTSIYNGFSGKFVWHFRDYPTSHGLYGVIWKLFKFKYPFQLCLVGNSKSVSKALVELKPCAKVFKVYNPVGAQPSMTIKNDSKEFIIAIVGMLAPWKGQLEGIKWFSENCHLIDHKNPVLRVYGEQIYKTQGEHCKYKDLLINHASKSKGKIEFMGNRSPEEIFSSIDVLMHTSIEPEPFGRVIIEAFKSKVPVLSTCIGGASELAIDQKTAWKIDFKKPDLALNSINSIAHNLENVKSVLDNAHELALDIEKQVGDDLSNVLAA